MSDYMLVDADNHYYEAEDAFTRYADEDVKRYVRWVQEGKRKRLMFGGKLSDTPANPTFNPISKAGAFHQRLKDLEAGKGRDASWEFARSRYGDLVPLPDAYRHKDARLDVLDEQNVEKCCLFPTLADCVEGLMTDDPEMGHKAYHAFNLWLEEDWGYNYKDRLYAPPYIPMLDPKLAADEAEFVVNKGARVLTVRPGPAAGRSPADPAFDRFWSIVDEAGILVSYHAYGGRTVYSDAFDLLYMRDKLVERAPYNVLKMSFTIDRGILEATMCLVLGNLFGRFPNVRVASIEMGVNWVPYVLHALDHAGDLLFRDIPTFSGKKVEDTPSEIFKRHVFVSPFPEEDVVGMAEMLGASQVLFGSDWPHPEGNVMPADYAECIQKLPEDDIKRIMRDNTLALLSPPR